MTKFWATGSSFAKFLYAGFNCMQKRQKIALYKLGLNLK